MDESIEITTEVPPDNLEASPAMMEAILKAISELDIATHADVIELNKRQDAQNARIEAVETALTELPKIYASVESLDKIKSSQTGNETSIRQLTTQVGRLTAITTDNQRKFTSIEARLADLTGIINNMTGNLNTFMDTQRAAVTNQQTTITEAKNKAETLSQEVATVKKEFSPVHDFIVGSETQKPMMAVVDGIHSQLNTISQQLTPAVDYITEQKKKEADRLSFWRAVRLQMWTWRGVLSMLLALVVFLIIVNSINFEQLFERIRQLADVIAGVLRAAKVG